MKLSNASSKYGAQMGRPNVLPDDTTLSCAITLERLKWIDGDYDYGGAYWGGPCKGDKKTFIYWAYGDIGEVVAQVFVRASNTTEAKRKVLEILPNAKIAMV